MNRHFRKEIPSWTVPVAIVILSVLSLGLLLPTLGYYWDDWAKILVSRLYGLAGYWSYYAEDRPLSGWTHILFTPMLGVKPIAWQVFQLALTVLSACALYWTLTELWPRARRAAAAVSLLFLVYPVFVQHPIAVTFHQQWLQYLFYLLSLGCMLHAARLSAPTQRRTVAAVLFSLLALVLAALQLTVTEYFAPLEFLRPLLLWVVIHEQRTRDDQYFSGIQTRIESFSQKSETGRGSKRPSRLRLFFAILGETLLRWLPYALLIGAYGVYRLFLIKLPGKDPYQAETLYALFSSPIPTLTNLGRVILQDCLSMLVSCWTVIVPTGPITSIKPFSLFTLGVAALAAGLVFIYLHRFQTEGSGQSETGSWVLEALIVGLAAVLLGAAPAWLTGREVVFDFHSNRYALPAIFGAALVWVALIEWLASGRAQKAILFAALIGLATVLQLQTANDYRWTWKSQTAFYWQLYWRAPGIQPGTALLLEKEPFANQGGFSTSAALNLLYPQGSSSYKAGLLPSDAGQPNPLSYWMYSLQGRFANGGTDPLSMTFYTQFRTLVFEGSSPRTVVFQYDLNQGSCLWAVNADDALNPFISGLVKDFIPASNLANLLPAAQDGWTPPADLFGAEPEHTWCYWYEKADLARQQADWKGVVALGDQAGELGYSPVDLRSNAPREWLPFLEGYARLERWDEARQITQAISEKDERYNPLLCAIWQRSATDKNILGQVTQELKCRK
jgi:hypothetical protein